MGFVAVIPRRIRTDAAGVLHGDGVGQELVERRAGVGQSILLGYDCWRARDSIVLMVLALSLADLAKAWEVGF
jgi:hypothetical protein